MNNNNRHPTLTKEDKGIQVGALHYNKYSQRTHSSNEMSTQTSLNQLDEYSQTPNISVVDKTVQTFVATDNSHTQTSGVYKTTDLKAKSPKIDNIRLCIPPKKAFLREHRVQHYLKKKE
ncbi:hypothetical protein CDAR_210341 [Caerostris darwini]|uniref:Uncharacterized protein n=1 Tax=Caerostris darwini TaxID=1538125 RepID=A0AAV4ML65_9ARAC|nr:hypothetical protein CDAR_210341 [Caerostris darwini]